MATHRTPPIDIHLALTQLEHQPQEHFLARIALSLLLCGTSRYLDEAHNLVLALSWRGELPYAYDDGTNVDDNEELQALACYAHCLIHRQEGNHDSEFDMTGFQSSNYWAGIMNRIADSLDTLQACIRDEVKDLCDRHGGVSAKELFQHEDAPWDPRILTDLCAEVVRDEGEASAAAAVKKEFCQRAAKLELKMLPDHVLSMIGIEPTMR